MILSDCEMMMEMNHQSHNEMDLATMNMMDHDDPKMSNDHCEMADSSSLYTVATHSLTECHCIDSKYILNGITIIPPKTTLSVLERSSIEFEKPIEEKHLSIKEINNFRPDPTPPDLFINYEALLI
jgi:hypothetical protein